MCEACPEMINHNEPTEEELFALADKQRTICSNLSGHIWQILRWEAVNDGDMSMTTVCSRCRRVERVIERIHA